MIFLKRAIEITSFNLTANDFTSTEYKEEIRFLFNDAWFPDLDTEKVFTSKTDANSLQKSINTLRAANPKGLKRLFTYKVNGIGPGELLLYYICTNGHLSGGSSAGVDLIIDGKNYEIKAVKPTKNGILGNVLIDFKLGGTVNLAPIVTSLGELLISKDLISRNYKKAEWSGKLLSKVRNTDEFAEIQKDFAGIAKSYFGEHNIIFLNNTANVKNVGNVLSMSNVAENSIFIERVTNGTVKPAIKNG